MYPYMKHAYKFLMVKKIKYKYFLCVFTLHLTTLLFPEHALCFPLGKDLVYSTALVLSSTLPSSGLTPVLPPCL